ncbi:hypothetical protein P152DRAFT_74687 [Eremomyces bilateralis CBS 781.70]|uniref:Uncharacterized protein n=1 Tax=Eremomyces bilateralis CBS 781.70 TaxID=1392243 RepID=A0A6G1FYT8_9PEZI|nr:uncharacterized protein P152DRAFT_74687 [Eremomyces bilateralis CBS 781.70]KAF1811035.1 hypothetical protein P152DRAFT_74687 [Eremomyces bilateralis CBS 781.70]
MNPPEGMSFSSLVAFRRRTGLIDLSAEPRDYSPPPRDRISQNRDDRRDYPERRRSPSPRRPIRDDYFSGPPSGRDSHATSRMSSPHGYPVRDRDDRDYRDNKFDSSDRDDGYRNGDDGIPIRAPPTGPAANRNFTSPITAPTGPSLLSAPSRPRGGPMGRGGHPRDDYRDYPSGPPRRGSSYNYQPPRGGYAPSGPRGGGPGSAPFRGAGNSTSTTYPRTQRFNNNNGPPSSSSSHLSDLPPIVSGGQKLPDVANMSKIEKLEEEARRLRESIEARELKKRDGVHDWDRLERENHNSAVRSELAEEHLRKLNGESELGDRAF